MLFSERKRMREIEEREAAGESFWTDQIPEPARNKVAWIWKVLIEESAYDQPRQFNSNLGLLFRSNGFGNNFVFDPDRLPQITDTDQFLNHVEAVHKALELTSISPSLFGQVVNDAFNKHRVAFRLVDGEVVPLESDELHVTVVEPTLRLLVDKKFEAAHQSYLKALKEISAADPADAITDAATALQEALVALGCSGNALGPLLKDAKKRGLLGSHDQTLIDGISKFIDWASADRSTTGDAHKHSDAVLGDAWLMVHIVGAVIVRLADGTPRATT